MHDVMELNNSIPAMSSFAIDRISQLEAAALRLPQSDVPTAHLIHAGMYARTIKVSAGVILTGALIKIATIIVIHGDVIVHLGDTTLELTGYNVLPASSNRKQAFYAQSDVHMTMIFTSDARDVYAAEEEFTDEADKLISRNAGTNHIVVTRE